MEASTPTTEPVSDTTAADGATVTVTPSAKKPAAKKPAAKKPAAKADKAPKAKDIHVVKNGEDILSIATEHSISLSTLKDLNGIRVGSGGVHVGQEIRLR